MQIGIATAVIAVLMLLTAPAEPYDPDDDTAEKALKPLQFNFPGNNTRLLTVR